MISANSPEHLHHEHAINRGSYMSAYVLLNLLNEMRKRDKMRGLTSILSPSRNAFNKFNNTGPPMLDSFYHMTLKILNNSILRAKTSRLCHFLRNIIMKLLSTGIKSQPLNVFTWL